MHVSSPSNVSAPLVALVAPAVSLPCGDYGISGQLLTLPMASEYVPDITLLVAHVSFQRDWEAGRNLPAKEESLEACMLCLHNILHPLSGFDSVRNGVCEIIWVLVEEVEMTRIFVLSDRCIESSSTIPKTFTVFSKPAMIQCRAKLRRLAMPLERRDCRRCLPVRMGNKGHFLVSPHSTTLSCSALKHKYKWLP